MILNCVGAMALANAAKYDMGKPYEAWKENALQHPGKRVVTEAWG